MLNQQAKKLIQEAIDVLSVASISQSAIDNATNLIKTACESIKNEKEEAVINQKFEKAAELRDKEKSLKEKFEKEQNKWKNKNTKSIVNITEENIAEVISNWTGIPARKITEDENEKLKNLEVNPKGLLQNKFIYSRYSKISSLVAIAV